MMFWQNISLAMILQHYEGTVAMHLDWVYMHLFWLGSGSLFTLSCEEREEFLS